MKYKCRISEIEKVLHDVKRYESYIVLVQGVKREQSAERFQALSLTLKCVPLHSFLTVHLSDDQTGAISSLKQPWRSYS